MNTTVRRYALARPRLRWQAGAPAAVDFDDVYFSAAGGLQETRHVFLAGNGLAERWSALRPGRSFVIGETGFGSGLNFLCSWQLWSRTAAAGARLHFVSCEQAPMSGAELQRAHAAFPELEPLAGRLRAILPAPVRGFHRLRPAPDVTLDLLYDEACSAWQAFEGQVDAWFLDGFAPARNPAMWREDLFAQLGRVSTAGTSLATYSVAAAVRSGLASAGFAVHKRPGYGHKRHMLVGEYRGGAKRPRPAAPAQATILGAGLAGSALAYALAQRGVQVRIVEPPSGGMRAASSTPRAVLFARLSPYDNPHARLQLACYLHAVRQLRDCAALTAAEPLFQACGVLQCAEPAVIDKWRLLADPGGLPDAVAEVLDRRAIRARWGTDAAQDGLWFADAGWLAPAQLCARLLDAAAVERVEARIAAISADERGFGLHDEHGRLLLSDALCILATGAETTSLVDSSELPLHRVRGQYTAFPRPPGMPELNAVWCGKGFLLPALDGYLAAGASYHHDDPEPQPRPADNRHNLEQAAALGADIGQALTPLLADTGACRGDVGWRATLPGRLPAIGGLGNGLQVLTGLGSRGLAFSALCAEQLAAQLCGEPWPLERELAQALQASRFRARN